MICFHFTIFVVLETTKTSRLKSYYRCDLLSFYYLCRTGNNSNPIDSRCVRVVICFHFTIFVVLETTTDCQTLCRTGCDLLSFYYLCRTGNNLTKKSPYLEQLWFAFILLSLSYWKQLCEKDAHQYHVVICFHFTIFVVLETTFAKHINTSFCCDLLSFYYLCRTGNNVEILGAANWPVVICFHFTIFVVLETTSLGLYFSCSPLWFAFILLSLSYWKQQVTDRIFACTCCDLLSFYYLCRTGNNGARNIREEKIVVICFHFTIFVVLETTYFPKEMPVCSLWFAFILLSLSYWKQPVRFTLVHHVSCDLLSFYYLCRTGNNYPGIKSRAMIVVICFHFTIFVVLETTEQRKDDNALLLWFAFILLSLSYWKQLHMCKHVMTNGCDLLSFYYLCRTGNNSQM